MASEQTLRNKYVAFTEQTVERFKLKVQYASTEDGALIPELRPEVLAAFDALPIEDSTASDDAPEDVPGASEGKGSASAPATKGNKYTCQNEQLYLVLKDRTADNMCTIRQFENP